MKNRILIGTIWALTCLTGCQSDEDMGSAGNENLADRVIRVTAKVNEEMHTRAGLTSDNLKDLCLVITDKENNTCRYNEQMVSDDNGGWMTYNGNLLLWNLEKSPVEVLAFAPYQKTDLKEPLTVDVCTDQTGQAAIEASDFLLHTPATVNPSQSSSLVLSFNHAMSRLQVRVMMGGETKEITNLTISGVLTKATCDLASKNPVVVAGGELGRVSLYRIETNFFECILPPQVCEEGVVITFNSAGRGYKWTSTETVTLQAGVNQVWTIDPKE